MTILNLARLENNKEFNICLSAMNSFPHHNIQQQKPTTTTSTSSTASPPFSLEGAEIEKSEPIVRLLAHVRKGGMDILFPQISHDKMLACIYVAITTTYTAAHRELLDLVMAVKDSGCISHVEHVSKTKIRGMLALLKHDDLLVTQSMEGQPARLCFAPNIQSFRDLRMRHDHFLERYMMEHHLFVPAFLKSEIVWQIDESTYYQRMEGLNHLMKNVAEFYAGYLGVSLPSTPGAISPTPSVPVRQMLPTNRNAKPLNDYSHNQDFLSPENLHISLTGLTLSSINNNNCQDHCSSSSSCTTLSDSTFGNDAFEANDNERLMNNMYNSNVPDNTSTDIDSSSQSVDWYAAGRQTSANMRTVAIANLQQQAAASNYLNRVSSNNSSRNNSSKSGFSPPNFNASPYDNPQIRQDGYNNYGMNQSALNSPMIDVPNRSNPMNNGYNQRSNWNPPEYSSPSDAMRGMGSRQVVPNTSAGYSMGRNSNGFEHQTQTLPPRANSNLNIISSITHSRDLLNGQSSYQQQPPRYNRNIPVSAFKDPAIRYQEPGNYGSQTSMQMMSAQQSRGSWDVNNNNTSTIHQSAYPPHQQTQRMGTMSSNNQYSPYDNNSFGAVNNNRREGCPQQHQMRPETFHQQPQHAQQVFPDSRAVHMSLNTANEDMYGLSAAKTAPFHAPSYRSEQNQSQNQNQHYSSKYDLTSFAHPGDDMLFERRHNTATFAAHANEMHYSQQNNSFSLSSFATNTASSPSMWNNIFDSSDISSSAHQLNVTRSHPNMM